MTKTLRFFPALALAAGVALASPACAARIYDTGYPRGASYPVYRNVSPAGDIGYRDGFDAGRDDARHRERFDPVRSRRYRSADHDYDRRYGPHEMYARDYRAAFERGYRDGYERGRRY
jgi:hypothetical protein